MSSFLYSLNHISENYSPILNVIPYILIGLIVLSLSILMIIHGLSILNAAGMKKLLQETFDGNKRKCEISQVLLRQHNYNESLIRKHKKPYNGFQPFTFQPDGTDLHLTHSQRIELAKII